MPPFFTVQRQRFVKFLVKFDLEFGLKFEIADGKNLVKFWRRTFLPARKARKNSGRITPPVLGGAALFHSSAPAFVKFLVKFDLEFGLKFEIADGKNLVNFGGGLFYLPGKHEKSGANFGTI